MITGSHSHRILRLVSFFLASFAAVLTCGIHLSHACSLPDPLLSALAAPDFSPAGNGPAKTMKADRSVPCIACVYLAMVHALQISMFVAILRPLAEAGTVHPRDEDFISNYFSSTRRSRAPPVSISSV